MPGEALTCELTGFESTNNELHHIDAKGMGGRPSKDVIENIMCVRVDLHLKYGDKVQYKEFLKKAHKNYMETRNVWVYENELPE